MKAKNIFDVVESYKNGNIRDTKELLKKMNKVNVLDFVSILSGTDPTVESWARAMYDTLTLLDH